jgi:ubiquinone biosynthesis protein UbiJ
MDSLEALLRPVTNILNRNIQETTPARELCRQLDGKTVAVRVRDTALAMYFKINDEVVVLAADSESDPDVVLTGSILTLARMAGAPEDAARGAAVRDGALDLTGDAYTAQSFQELLAYAKPDIEEELSTIIGDAAAHRAGKLARSVSKWAKNARMTMGSNIREYLQEESRDVPSRYEVERFTRQVDSLRDDVARLEARLNRLTPEA